VTTTGGPFIPATNAPFVPFVPAEGAGTNGTNGRFPGLVTLDEVGVERVRWLWPGRLPVGKLVVVDGDPSTGKTTMVFDLGARLTRAGLPSWECWPDGSAPDDGITWRGVLVLSAEDGVADTIAPRFAAAGADLGRVHVLKEVPVLTDDGARMAPPSLPRDIPTIKKLIDQNYIGLVVVDVFMAFLSGKVDSHRDQDVRGVLHQLAKLAEDTGTVIVLIRHLNKAGGSNALYRGGGSIGIVGAARSAFLVARDPDDTDRRILACTKSNLGREPMSLAYRLVDDPDHGCARVEWEDGPVEHTAASLLRAPESYEDASESGDAAAWLRDHLEARGGSDDRKSIIRAARAEGWSDKVLRRAREKAGVVADRRGFAGRGASQGVWYLPSLVPTEPRSCPQDCVGTSAENGHERCPDCGDPVIA
jgi:hypothetical protein